MSRLSSAMNPGSIHHGTPPMGGPNQGNPAADAQVAWNQKFGPYTATQVGQQRDAGQPVGQSAPTAGANNLQLADGSQPGMAGGNGANTEAAFPGYFKGNPEPGIPPAEAGMPPSTPPSGTGFGPPPGPGDKGRLSASLGDPTQKLGITSGIDQGGAKPAATPNAPAAAGTPLSSPPPQPQATPPQVPGGTDPGAAAVLAQGATAQASQPRSPVATGAQSPTMVSETPKGATETGGVSGATYGTRGHQGVQYTLNKPLPAGWAGLTEQARVAWLKKNATPVSQLQADAAGEVQGMLGKDRKLPQQDPNGPDPVVLRPGMSEIERANAIGDPTLSSMATQVMAFEARYGNSPQNTNFGGMPAKEKAQFEAGLKEYNAFRTALAQYGIYFPDNAPATPDPGGGGGGGPGPGGGGGGGGPGGGPGGTGGGGAGGGDGGPVNNEGPIQNFPDGGTAGAPVEEYGPNYDISSPSRGIDWYLAQYTKMGLEPMQAALRAEAAWSAAQADAQYNNRQSDVNISAGALNEFKGSDLYRKSQETALSALNEGDPTDWEGIKNRRASDAAADVASTRDTLSTSGARRGLSAGAITGIGTRAASDSRMNLSRALGELDVQEAQSKRNYESQALNNALSTMAGTSGVALSGAYNIGSKIAGTSQDYGNPYESYASGVVNIEAAKAKIEAAEDAGGATWGDIAAIGGIIAAPFTGGASLALTTAAAGKGPKV